MKSLFKIQEKMTAGTDPFFLWYFFASDKTKS